MDLREQINTRMYVMLTWLSIMPLLVAGQILRIHLTDGAELREIGSRQASTWEVIPALRGSIFDQAGRALVINAARYDLALDPTAPGFDGIRTTFFDRLSRLTGEPVSTLRRRVEGRSSRQFVLMRRGITEAQKEEIESWEIPGLILSPEYTRRYNYGSAAAHALGFVDADGTGIAGVELQYDAFLRGEDGRRAVKRDRLQQMKGFVGGAVIEPKHGENLRLTIDLIRQTIVEEELARGMAETGANWGTVIAMDPHTGAILAIANNPTYDPNRAGIAGHDARRNRAVTDRIEPGSTFKLVASIAAVEQGLVTLQDTIDTGQGWGVFGGRTMRDTRAHGRISFSDVLSVSSNVGTARVASQLRPGTFYQYARNLGFGQPTYVDLPGEVSGLLKKPSEWSGTTLTSMSIGYEIDATPIQLLVAYSALANGGLVVQPYLVKEREDLTGRVLWQARPDSIRRAFRRETARSLLPAFESVVNTGTATQAAVEGLPVAGKTGTARKVEGGRYQMAYRASFAGFFPADDPVVAMIVVLDEPRGATGGGAVAAPIFGRIAQRWIGTFPKIAAQMAPEGELPVLNGRTLPDITGQPAAIASARLLALGFDAQRPARFEQAQRVERQQPAAGAEAMPGRRVRLETQRVPLSEESMPDLTGLSARQAMYWMASRGIEARIEGTGVVVSQSPAAGEPLPERALVRCREPN
jgi:cell division protein FtsI (penicillin-binding protein 3)